MKEQELIKELELLADSCDSNYALEINGYNRGVLDALSLVNKYFALASVSKRFEIDFDGNLLAGIEITNNEPKVFGAINGWGDGISPDNCKITDKTTC